MGVSLGIMKGEVIRIISPSGSELVDSDPRVKGLNDVLSGSITVLAQEPVTVDMVHRPNHGFREHEQTTISWKLANSTPA